MQTHDVLCNFSQESWSILSDIERRIKEKIEKVGVALRDWDVEVYRGILTGYNDAFIISTQKREELLSQCSTDEEREKTAEIIRPILRGRDIGRYSDSWADLWLIWIPWHFPYHFDNSFQGASKEAEDAFKTGYPTLYDHLSEYKNELSARNKAETGIRYEWYALQRWGANYWDIFSQPKIIWKRVGSIIRFSYDEKGVLGLDSTCFATGKHIPYLCCVLNSSMGHYLLNGAPRTGTGDLLISVQAVEPIRVPVVQDMDDYFIDLVKRASINPSKALDEEIDNLIFELYGLNQDEKDFIINNFQ